MAHGAASSHHPVTLALLLLPLCLSLPARALTRERMWKGAHEFKGDREREVKTYTRARHALLEDRRDPKPEENRIRIIQEKS